MQRHSLVDLVVRLGKVLPFLSFEDHVVAYVDSQVSTCSYGPACVLEFFFVGDDGDAAV